MLYIAVLNSLEQLLACQWIYGYKKVGKLNQYVFHYPLFICANGWELKYGKHQQDNTRLIYSWTWNRLRHMCLDVNVPTPHKPPGFILTASWLGCSKQPGAIMAVLEKSLETKDHLRQEFLVTGTWL